MKQKIEICVDCMGGDLGSGVIVKAVKDFVLTHDDVSVFCYGKKEELESLNGIARIIDCKDVVPMEAGPIEVMRLKDASMTKGMKDLKEHHYDAIVSCGSTGGFLSSAALVLKNIPNVKRAALLSPFPTKVCGKKVVILDIGANNENSAEELVQFAKMGSIYCQNAYNIEKPKVYLLSNGTEEKKGSPQGKIAHLSLKEDKNINFCGNIEARDVLNGEADVVVTDGYSGNIFLKSSEGMAKMMSNLFKGVFKKNIFTKLGTLFMLKGIKNIKKTMDYKSTGGALLIGVNGIVIKAHGNSDDYAFFNALQLAYSLSKKDVVCQITKEFNHE